MVSFNLCVLLVRGHRRLTGYNADMSWGETEKLFPGMRGNKPEVRCQGDEQVEMLSFQLLTKVGSLKTGGCVENGELLP